MPSEDCEKRTLKIFAPECSFFNQNAVNCRKRDEAIFSMHFFLFSSTRSFCSLFKR